MPRFTGQNKKRIDPRWFLNETEETWSDTGYDKGTGAYGPAGAEEYSTASARDKVTKDRKEELILKISMIMEERMQVSEIEGLYDILDKDYPEGTTGV